MNEPTTELRTVPTLEERSTFDYSEEPIFEHVLLAPKLVPLTPDSKLWDAYLRWTNGNVDAAHVLAMLGGASQMADDFVDGDVSEERRGDVMALLLITLLGELPNNVFYQRHRNRLEAILVSSVLMWNGSNKWARGDAQDRRYAYVYRETMEQVIGVVALLTGGHAHAIRTNNEVHGWFHRREAESFETWEREAVSVSREREVANG